MSRTTVMHSHQGGAAKPKPAIQCDFCPQAKLLRSEIPRGWGQMADGRHYCVACKMRRAHDPLGAKPVLVRCACGVSTTEKDRAGHVARCRGAA